MTLEPGTELSLQKAEIEKNDSLALRKSLRQCRSFFINPIIWRRLPLFFAAVVAWESDLSIPHLP